MLEIPAMTGEDFARIFRRMGFLVICRLDNHVTIADWKYENIITIPVHPGKKLAQELIRKALLEMRISMEVFLDYLFFEGDER